MRNIKIYNNYHKHSHISNISSPDCNVKAEDYCKKAVEYGHTTYFTTEHGNMGDIFEAKTLCEKYGLKCLSGIEGYIVPDAQEKDKSNYHIVIIPKTNDGRHKLNYLSSMANMKGYYFKPRFDTAALLTLDKDDVFITTACMAGILRDETAIEKILLPLAAHFRDNLFLEVQNHLNPKQEEINRKALNFSEEMGLRLIAANDSHYIDSKDKEERNELLKGKKITYADEDSFILDYPDYDTMFERFQKQGVLTDRQIEEAIDNTLIFDCCEEIYLDKSIKMPTIYPGLSLPQRIDLLKMEINNRFAEIKKEENIIGEELKKYISGIRYEMKIIEDTNDEIHTADYFLLNEKLVSLAVNKYDGVLTRGGRGSCGSFYINRILGMTQLDRFRINLPIFPDRFASTARLLENRSLPDIDFNVKEQEPFIKAAKELLGEHGCYPMIAYGTMQIGEAFRNLCRSKGLAYDEFNEVAKNLDRYKDDKKWREIIKEAEKYVGTIVSSSVHPCAFLLSDKNILYEYGVVKVGDAFCVMVTSGEADEWKLLKDDFLIVSVWKLIDETFKEIGIPIIPARELLQKIKDDDKVWALFKNGLTCTLNQVDSDNGMRQAKEYGISSFEEGAFVAAAIRPSFDAWRNQFLHRQPYTTGSKDLDEVLSMTNHYILFQENLMQYFDWLGISPAESIGLIKKISKKKIKPEDFEALEGKLKENWIKNTGSEYMFAETWHMIQGCISYGFAAPHAAATSLDMCYGAYLKANYPYEYYTVCFENYSGDELRTRKLKNELKYFGITLDTVAFRHSRGRYSFDKEKHIIYKGIGSIKYLNSDVAEELYSLRDNSYDSFTDLLYDIKEKTGLNTRQRDVLIKIDYFKEFGDINKLLYTADLFDKLNDKCNIKYNKAKELGLAKEPLIKYSEAVKETRIEAIDYTRLLQDKGVENVEDFLSGCIKYKYELNDKTQIKEKIFNGYNDKKIISKVIKEFDLSPEELVGCSTKIVYGQYVKVDMRKLVRYMENIYKGKKCSLQDKIKWQLEYFGYVEYTNPVFDKRYVVITGLDKKYTPRFNAYCISTGEIAQMQIHKAKSFKNKRCKSSFSDTPVDDGDIIYMRDCSKELRKMKTENGYVSVPGEYVWWINDYKKTPGLKEEIEVAE